MVDDLTAIPGLEDRHRRRLELRLGITTYGALAQADPEEIFNALARNRPPPTLEMIKAWQGHARRRLVRQAGEAPDWSRTASFVISFEERQVGGETTRRLVAEQTELEPEQRPTSWPSWDFGGLDDWLRERLGGVPLSPPAAELPEPEAGQPGSDQEVSPDHASLRLDSVVVVDASGRRVEAVTRGQPSGLDLQGTLPGHIEILVTGGTPEGQVFVALRFREPGRPRWSPQPPIAVRGQNMARLELSEEAVGRHHARVGAWTPDAAA